MRTQLSNIQRSCILALAFFWMTAVFSCTWPGPHLQHNWAVEKQFDSYKIYPEHQYYTGGTLEDPRAVLALKTDYILDSPNWQKVNMTTEELERWIQALKKDSFVEYNTFSNGARVVGDSGEIAGYYYSVWEFPLVRIPKEKTILMAVPDAEYRSTNMRIEFFTGDDSRERH